MRLCRLVRDAVVDRLPIHATDDPDPEQWGGSGRDLMVDGLGHDLLVRGTGRDAFLYLEASPLGGSNPDDGGRFVGGSGTDTLYLALDAPTQAAVEAELRQGSSQWLDAIGVTTRSIEHYVFVDPDDPAASPAAPGCTRRTSGASSSRAANAV